MNSQESLTDQLAKLAILADDEELSEEATWLRAGGIDDIPKNMHIVVKLANLHGLYDAADWIDLKIDLMV